MGVLIRKAEPKDLETVLVELKKFSDFFDSKYPMYGPDEEHNKNLILNLINNHLFLVAELNGEVIGFIAGLITNHFFNPDIKILSEVFWWVKPKHRMTGAGSMLLKEFNKFGEENCQWVVMTLEAISPVKPESILSHGFKLKEQSFIREV